MTVLSLIFLLIYHQRTCPTQKRLIVFSLKARLVEGERVSKPQENEIKANPNLDIHMIIESLDHLDQGITIFDEHLELQLFNKKFQTMFEFPDGFLTLGKSFESIIKHNVDHGEYGDGNPEEQLVIRLQRAKKFVTHRFKRKRPNGTTVDVSGSPLPNGGFVTIYTDITEYALREDTHKREQEQSAALLQATLENISQGISLIDTDLTIAVSNQRFSELLDLPKDFSNPGTTFEEIIRYNAERGEYGSGDIEGLVAERLSLAAEMKPHHFKRERPDGTIIDIVGKPLPDIGFVTTYEDVTIKETNKNILEEQEEQYRTYIETSPIGALLVKKDGTVLYSNTRFQEMFGFLKEEVKTYSAREFYFDPKDRKVFLETLLKEGSTANLRFIGKKKDGTPFPILTKARLMKVKGKQRIFSWIYDLTDLNEAEKTINNLSQQNQLILSAAGAGIFGIDLKGYIQFINPAAAKLLEYAEHELKGKHLSALFKEGFDVDKIIRHDEHRAEETQIIRKSKTTFPIRYTVSKLEDGGILSGTVIVFDDISERIAAEEVLYQAMKDIEVSSRAKSHFLSTMSHELRTPLNAILGFAQILEKNQDSNLTTKQITFIDHLHRAGNHLLKLINEAIDVAAIETGQITLSKQTIFIHELIDTCHKLSSELAREKDITLTKECEQNTNLCVIADQARLQQIIMHLLSNAIKHNDTQGTVGISCIETDQQKVRIIITDSGRGIPQEEVSEIFEPFNRSQIQGGAAEGTGLGLTLTKHLAEIMGGTIGFTTEFGVGSSFWAEFPSVDKNGPMLINNSEQKN